MSDRASHALGSIVYETGKTNRKRKRKVKDRDWFWEVGLALLADLAYHFLSGSPGTGLVVVRAKSQLGKEDSR